MMESSDRFSSRATAMVVHRLCATCPGGWALTGESNDPSRSVVCVHRTYDVSLVRG